MKPCFMCGVAPRRSRTASYCLECWKKRYPSRKYTHVKHPSDTYMRKLADMYRPGGSNGR